MKNKYFNTFIRKITDKETKESKICISNFPQDIIFELINYIRNYWNGGYSGYVYIREKINIKNRVMIHEISLSYCIFEKDFAIENSKIREMSLNKSIFNQKVSFSKSIFKCDVLEEENHSKQPFESGSFLETKFKDIVDFSNTFLYNVKFENVDFIGEGKNIYFQKSSLYDIKFKNVNFNFSTHFNNSEIEKLYFEGTTFRGNTNFREISFNGETKFLNCTFTSLQNDTSEEVSFSGSIFKQEANFSGSKFQIKISFSYFEKDKEKVGATSLKDKVDFKDCVFTKEANFSKTIFEGDTNFSRSTFCVVSFQNAVFSKNVRFHETIFHNNVDFFNTSFKGLVDFYLVKFEDNQQFHTTDFLDRAIFSNTTFKGETQFIYNKVDKNSYINFESAKFEKGLDISRANFNCNLNFWNIFIQNKNISEFTKYVDDFGEHKEEATPSVYKQLRETYRIIKDNFYKQNNKIEGGKFYKRELEIYEISIGKDKNKDKENGSLSFLLKTFNIYRNITSIIMWLISTSFLLIVSLSSIFPFKIIDSNVTTILNENPLILILLLLIYTVLAYSYYGSDKIILIANKISNDFGTNWVKGVLFTVCITILTYMTLSFSMLGLEGFTIISSIYISIVSFFISIDLMAKKKIYFIGTILSIIVFVFYTYSIGKYFNFRISIKIINDFIGDFINIHTFISWKDLKINHKEVTGISLLILFIGRIFIGYGYYQTIQAFRKFGKS